jgi:hypothetical protein
MAPLIASGYIPDEASLCFFSQTLLFSGGAGLFSLQVIVKVSLQL